MPDVSFGYERVTATEKAQRVDQVFHSVSNVYDPMNDAMSLGIHRLWKDQAVASLDCYQNDIVADLSCGTGDLSRLIIDRIPYGQLHCIDPNQSMLDICHQRLGEHNNTHFHTNYAEKLDFNQQFDKLMLSFGLRNFSDEDTSLNNIFNSLKVGGKFVIMEFNPPKSSSFDKQYEMYLKYIIPCLGQLLGQDESSYQYLADSIQQQPCPKERIEQLKSHGFDFIKYTPLTMGVVGLFECYRCQ
jgi:demethylmenaquinone methyltransferase/2-methoxy-6-polyprenyl-1,4-benzoquinol methylase